MITLRTNVCPYRKLEAPSVAAVTTASDPEVASSNIGSDPCRMEIRVQLIRALVIVAADGNRLAVETAARRQQINVLRRTTS